MSKTITRNSRQVSIQPARTSTGREPLAPSSQSALARTATQLITARLAAAGSRRGELEALLHAAPSDATPSELHTLVVDANVTGKGSAASRDKVWRQLKQNYVLDPAVSEYRALRQALDATSVASERGLLLYLLFARGDRLFRDLTLASVSPFLSQSGTPIQVEQVQATLERLIGKERAWSEETRVTARQHALSALKDFGVLEGGTRKRTARLHPGPQVTLFAARLALLEGLSPRQTLASAWFALLGLDSEGAWELLREAASMGVLACRRQANVVEIELPPLPGDTDAAASATK